LKSQLANNNQTISTNVQLILEQKVKILNLEEEIKKNSRELNLNCQILAENKCELNNLRITNEIQVNELKSTVCSFIIKFFKNHSIILCLIF